MPRTKKTKPDPVRRAESSSFLWNGSLGEVLTLAEAAAYLRLPEAEVMGLVHSQGLPGRIVGGEVRFLKAAIQQWLSTGTATPEIRKAAQLAAAGAFKDDPVVTQIEALRGRHDALVKAEDGARLLRAQEGLLRTLRHLALFQVVALDAGAAAAFDRTRANKRLKKIGRRDLLIACIALAHRATLITRNLKDFRQVPGLHVENWAD